MLGLLVIAALNCHAQGVVLTNSGWYPIGAYDVLASDYTNDEGGTEQIANNIQQQTPPTPPVIAEAVTPEIQALADGLEDDPLQIFNYVHDHIRYVLYFGAQKGANLTLLEKSGNDFDQCALLVALLRAAGYTNASYQFGWMILPFDNPDGSGRDLRHWLELNFTNTNWSATVAYLKTLFGAWRGYPGNALNIGGSLGNNTFAFQRVWVVLPIGGTNYYLDPAFKVSEPVSGISLATAMGGSASAVSNALWSAAGGTEVGDPSSNYYVSNLDEAAIAGTLTGYTTNLLNDLESNCPNASVAQVLGGWRIVPSSATTLPRSLPFATTNMDGTMPVINWANEPTNLMFTLKLHFGGKNCQWFMPQLQGQRLSLVYSASAVSLWQEDSKLLTGSFSGSDSVTITTHYPFGWDEWDTTNNVFLSKGGYTAASTATYHPNSDYAILYSFEPDWGWLRERQRRLELYRQEGLANNSRQVTTETLNIMGLDYALQTEDLGRMLGRELGVLPMNYQMIGRMAQESGRGYYVDYYAVVTAAANNVGIASGPGSDPNSIRWGDLFGYFASAMESGVIEQLQASNLVAASTIKMLETANTNHQAIYLATSTNLPIIMSYLVNYNYNDLGLLVRGKEVLLPHNGLMSVGSGSHPWKGHAFVIRWANNFGIQMAIGPGYYGGYAGDLYATVDPGFIDFWSYSQPLYFSAAPPSLPSFTAADPVDMVDGTFQAESEDLSLGGKEPRGLSFIRYYNSRRRTSNLAGIAPGWLNNYYLNAATLSAPQAALGGTTPAQAAAMLAATTAANALYDKYPDPKNWMVTALIAKWGVDQITAKAVSVSLGNKTLQFIKQPDGSFTPPAGCTLTLSQAGAHAPYVLHERRGRTYYFNPAGWVTNIADPYHQSLKLTYNSSNWVSTVSDWKQRTLTLNYSTTNPKRLVSVVDSAGRRISFGYSSRGDLTSVVDPENKTNSFLYDTNHQITATYDALGQLVASNIYNNFGRITTQFTEGDPNQTWKIFWSGWQTIEQDPAGSRRVFFYDDQGRLTGLRDQLTNLTRTFYDGQDHVIETISPLNETNLFFYDGNNNLVQTVDPLGFTNRLVYDSQDNLVQAVDPRGDTNFFGYNAEYSLIGETNGAGDWVNYAYNSDGTLHSRADAGGTTYYDGYDNWGQLTHITYPAGLGAESFVNDSLGDVTQHTDGNGNVTSFQYDPRRELTNTVAPASVMTRRSFDAVGNLRTVTDARHFTTTQVWSPTRHLLATILPATPGGVPVITNIYDHRDWLSETLDPLQEPTSYTNNAAGWLIAQTDPLRRTATFGYDDDGRRITTTNPSLETTRQTWDGRGKLIQLTDGDNHTSVRVYDPAGNQVILTNRNGMEWQFQFDGANRLTNTLTPLRRTMSQTWNHQGLLSTLTDGAHQLTSLYYDARGRLTNRVDAVGSTFYGYDGNDNPTNVSENGLNLSWTYDAYNRVSTYRDAYGKLIQYRYDGDGNLTNLVYPGNRNVYYFYDSLNRLTNVTDWASRKTSFTYDLAGHLKTISRPNGTYRTLGYDAAGEVTNILEQTAVGFPIALMRYNWNSNSTMQWEFAAPLPHPVTLPTRTMTYNDDNELITVNGQNVYSDANGNLTNAPLPGGAFAIYKYDARNRLLDAGGVTNVYDADNNRIAQFYGTNVVSYVINPNSRLPQVLMRIKGGVTNYYVYGLGLLYQVTETATSTNALYYHYDYRGSTIALTDDNGLVKDRFEYSLYGTMTYRTGTDDTPFQFNGRYGVMTDPNGLLYMNARFYSPYLCRFVSSDPSGFSGGLNFYAAFNGNPVTYLDPFGLGALGENMLSSSWMPRAPTAFERNMSSFLTSFVDFATLGMANQASTALTGSDLYGNPATSQQRTAAAVSFGLNFIPGLDVESGAARVATDLGDTLAETTGTQLEFGFARGASVQTPGVTTAGETFVRVGAAPKYLNFSFDGAGGALPKTYAMPEATFNAIGRDPATLKNLLDLPGQAPVYYRYLQPPPGTLIQRGIVPGGEFGGVGGMPEVLFPKGF